LIKLNNYREDAAFTGQSKDSKGKDSANTDALSEDHQSEQFQPEKIPAKIPLVRPDGCSGGPVMAYHCEAPYQVRRHLIDQARKTFKELEKAETPALLSHSYQRTKMLEERFEENLVKNNGFGRGNQHVDPNCKIVFKTFLQDWDKPNWENIQIESYT